MSLEYFIVPKSPTKVRKQSVQRQAKQNKPPNPNDQYCFINCDKFAIIMYDVIYNGRWVWVYGNSLYSLSIFLYIQNYSKLNVYLKNLFPE